MSKKDESKAEIAIIPVEPPPDPPPEPKPVAEDGVSLEHMLLRELDEAAQETYGVFCDSLLESGELQATQWHGLNDAVKKAWRVAVLHVRHGEAVADVSR